MREGGREGEGEKKERERENKIKEGGRERENMRERKRERGERNIEEILLDHVCSCTSEGLFESFL